MFCDIFYKSHATLYVILAINVVALCKQLHSFLKIILPHGPLSITINTHLQGQDLFLR